jgi:hypothetical protein
MVSVRRKYAGFEIDKMEQRIPIAVPGGADDRRGGAVAEDRVAYDEARIVAGKHGGRTDFDRYAQDRLFRPERRHPRRALEVREGRSAPHPHDIEDFYRRVERERFDKIRGQAGAKVSGAGIDDEAAEIGGRYSVPASAFRAASAAMRLPNRQWRSTSLSGSDSSASS